jgi:hypothetical protein
MKADIGRSRSAKVLRNRVIIRRISALCDVRDRRSGREVLITLIEHVRALRLTSTR